jgi:hypothetical protein
MGVEPGGIAGGQRLYIYIYIYIYIYTCLSTCLLLGEDMGVGPGGINHHVPWTMMMITSR